MIFNKYIVLILSIGLFYYSIFRFKGEKLLRKIYIIISSSSCYNIILRILDEDLKVIDANFTSIIMLPAYFGLAVAFYLLIIYNWKHRKEPERKNALYVGSIALILAAILFAIVYFRLKK
ncbi:MAG: hypothetical protein A2Y23_11600 [Clostridiales bacterium GWB2_37_7]|nr:MAG: hypothetical protein A2Y23_11600 [Clostridiales bacterium GWB2_37_7]